MRNRIVTFALLSLLLISIASAQTTITTCMGSACNITAEYSNNWMPDIAILIVIVFLILGLAFAIVRAFGRRDLEAIIRAELYQTVIATIWVVIVAGLAITSCTVACGASGGNNPFVVAVQYTQSVQNSMENSIVYLIGYAREQQVNAAVLVDFGGGFGDLYIKPFAGCAEIANSIQTVTSVFTTFLGSLVVQQMALSFIYTSAFTVLLPLGFVLRILPFFREAGAFLIGLALALYVVFPLTYVFADRATASYRGISIASLPSPGFTCSDPTPITDALQILGYGLVQAAFFPALSMIITLASARVLSKVFIYDFQEL